MSVLFAVTLLLVFADRLEYFVYIFVVNHLVQVFG